MTATGKFLDAPEFGPAPEPGFTQSTRPRKPYPWEPMLATIREHPGQWALIAQYKAADEGGRKGTQRLLNNDITTLRRFWRHRCPLEEWAIMQRTVEGTWGDRELRVMYVGDLTPEEAERLRELTAAAYNNTKNWGHTEKERHLNRLQAKQDLDMERNRIAKRRLG